VRARGHPRVALARRRRRLAQGEAYEAPVGDPADHAGVVGGDAAAQARRHHAPVLRPAVRGDRRGPTRCCAATVAARRSAASSACRGWRASRPRRIGLSATIGDPESTGRLLAQGTGRGCVIPQVQEPGRTWRLSMEHFFIGGAQVTQPYKYPAHGARLSEGDRRRGPGAHARTRRPWSRAGIGPLRRVRRGGPPGKGGRAREGRRARPRRSRSRRRRLALGPPRTRLRPRATSRPSWQTPASATSLSTHGTRSASCS
jgi:hypothetical protein